MLNMMFALLRDPIVAVILGASSLFVALRARNTGRRLRWAIVSDTRLSDMKELEIDGVPDPAVLDSIRVVSLQLWNDGDTSIPPQAIYRPITVEFINAEVYSVVPVKLEPSDPTIQVVQDRKDRGKLTIKKALLSPGGTIALVCTLIGCEGAPLVHVDASIDGVRQIRSGLPDKQNLIILVGIAAASALVACLSIANNPATALTVTGNRISVASYIVMPIIIMYLDTSKRRRIKHNRPRRAAYYRYIVCVWLIFIFLTAFMWTSISPR